MIVTSDKVSDDCGRGDSTRCIEYEHREEATEISAISSGGLHRRLNNRHIQLTAIGGTIGTGLFISIGSALATGGPGNLLLCFLAYSCVISLINNSAAEMVTQMPISGGFIRLAGHWVDDALGFAIGWNFFLYEALLIPFEIVALNGVTSYWAPEIVQPGPLAGFCLGVIIFYGLLNIVAVSVFGEAEFWLSSGKVILMFIVFAFTFITMVGGNPQGDAYGFRYWNNPGPFVSQAASTEALGHFEGFLSVLAVAAFIIVGPDYITMIAAEAKHPSIYIKTAFKTVYFRFGIFFIGSALAVGVVLPSNDPKLQQIFIDGEGSSSAVGSPYVIAMTNMGITVLPHIVNALLFTSILSAGNTYTYCSVRCLYGLAVQGHAPSFLKRCTNKGIPVYCFLVTMLFPFLSFLSVSNGSANALNILLSLIAGGGLVNYVVISITYLRYYNACKVQGVNRRNLPYYGYFQPYGAWISLVLEFLVAIGYGYSAFTPWSVQGFFANYTMQLLAPILYIFWKVVKKSKLKEGSEVDLVWERPAIDIYESQTMIDDPPISFWKEIGTITGMNRAGRYFFGSSDRS